MLFKGTSITRGTGEGLVTATGMKTEIGTITSLTQEAEEEETPMEKRLDKMGHRLIWATLGIMVLVAVTGLLADYAPDLPLEDAYDSEILEAFTEVLGLAYPFGSILGKLRAIG